MATTHSGVAIPFSATQLDLPGMDAALRGAGADTRPGDFAVVERRAANAWVLAIGEMAGTATAAAAAGARDAVPTPTAREAVLTAAGHESDVISVLHVVNRWLRAHPDAGRASLRLAYARLELDRCGAWVSLGCGGCPLPVLVRRAGWIDVRGQRGPSLGTSARPAFGEDRVGLGPGDALVFASSAVTAARDAAGETFGEEALPTTLLASAGRPAAALADRVLEAAAAHAGGRLAQETTVLVIRVPDDAAEDPDARLRAALGSYVDAGRLPDYPVGQPHWAPDRRPAPPREARILLAPATASVPVGRRFVTSVLHSWRQSELAEAGDVELITSELVGNAVRHGRREVTVLVGYDAGRLRVGVGDGSRQLPHARQANADDVSGRGLLIVEALAAAVGVSHTVGGKRVWAEVDVPPAPPTEARSQP